MRAYYHDSLEEAQEPLYVPDWSSFNDEAESVAKVCAGWVVDDLNKLSLEARKRVIAAMKERSLFCWGCGETECSCKRDER